MRKIKYWNNRKYTIHHPPFTSSTSFGKNLPKEDKQSYFIYEDGIGLIRKAKGGYNEAKEFIESITDDFYSDIENPIKKRDLYNIYKGYEIKYYPEQNKYIGYNSNVPAHASTHSSSTLKELKNKIDNVYTRDFHESYLSNPMKKRKNSAINIAGNPLHFPKMKSGRPKKRGRPAKTKPTKYFGKGPKPKMQFWTLTIYKTNGNLDRVLGSKGPKADIVLAAQKYSQKRGVSRVELNGPFKSMPNISTSTRH